MRVAAMTRDERSTGGCTLFVTLGRHIRDNVASVTNRRECSAALGFGIRDYRFRRRNRLEQLLGVAAYMRIGVLCRVFERIQ